MAGEIIFPFLLLVALIAISARVIWLFPPAILLMNVAYSAITKTASTLYLELNTTYLFETAIYSGPSGATVRQLILNGVIFAFAILVSSRLLKRPLPSDAGPRLSGAVLAPPPAHLFWAMAIAGFLLLLQFGNVLLSPQIPFLTGVGRQQFWTFNIAYPLLRDAFGVLVLFAPCIASYALGISFVRKNSVGAIVAASMLVVYFAFLILSGQKFNGLVVGLLMSVAPFWIVVRAARVEFGFKKWAIAGAVLVALFLLIGLIGFDDRGISQERGGLLGGLAYRVFALQGGVYYSADKLVAAGQSQGTWAILFGDMEQTIRLLAPSALADRYILTGVNLAGSLPGTALMVGGMPVAIMVCAANGVLMGLMAGFFARRILLGRPFDLLLLAYIYLWVNTVYGRGSFDEILSLKFGLFTGVLIVSGIVFSRMGSLQPKPFGKSARIGINPVPAEA